MKKGFTLIELTIGIVIIGLLIGGIVVAAALIETAKINSFVSQMAQYDSAVVGFKDKFKQLPGDSTIHSPAGNGDGILVYNRTTNAIDGQNNCFVSEMYSFWKHLSDSEMIKDSYSGSISNGMEAGVNMASTPFGDKVGVFAGTYYLVKYTSSSTQPFSVGQNFYSIRGNTNSNSSKCQDTDGTKDLDNNESVSGQPLETARAFAIDKKLDDGSPSKGRIRAMRAKEIVATSGWCNPPCVSGGRYAFNISGSRTALAIKMESIAGTAGDFK